MFSSVLIIPIYIKYMTSLVAQMVKNLPAVKNTLTILDDLGEYKLKLSIKL